MKKSAVIITFIFSQLILLTGQTDTTDSHCFPFLDMIGDTIPTGSYRSAAYIRSNGIIIESENVELVAPNSISLEPGFAVESGAQLTIALDGCEPDPAPYPPLVLVSNSGDPYSPPRPNNENQRVMNHCEVCGHFLLEFFDNNVGFDDSDLVLAEQRRTVACDVFKDISALVVNPNLPPGTVRIEIMPSFIDDSGGSLAVAEVWHALGFNDGIDDSGVWRTIMTGRNAWEHLDVIGATAWPHGRLSVNFDSARPYVYNDSVRNLCVNAGERDFYSIVLHEAMHLLGVYSLLDGGHPNRLSHLTDLTLSRFQHVYSRFDQHVFSSGLPIISYNSPFVLGPNMSAPLLFDCPVPNNIFFNGSTTANQSIFTGKESGMWWDSNLSHLNCIEDDTYTTNPTISPGTVQRIPHPNEVTILQDLGYSISGTYGTMNCPADPECNPSTNCNTQDHVPFGSYTVNQSHDLCHIGVNDQYTGLESGIPFTINATGTTGYLDNDIFPFGPSTQITVQTNPDAGIAVLLPNGDIEFTPNPTFFGTTYLLYVVECPQSQQGNITYIILDVDPPQLALCDAGASTCENILCWGDFEDFIPGQFYAQTPYNSFGTECLGASRSVDICHDMVNNNNYANVNTAIDEIILLPLSSPLLPGCTATIDFSMGFNRFNVDETNPIPGVVHMWMSEDSPCEVNRNDLGWVCNASGQITQTPSLNGIYTTTCSNPTRIFEVVNIHRDDTYLGSPNPRGVCIHDLQMDSYSVTWQNNTGKTLNQFYITGSPTGGGFAKFDDITITSSCLANEVTITANPDPIELCGTNDGSIAFTLCSAPSSTTITAIDYEAVATIPALRSININNPIGSVLIAPGSCQTISFTFNSDLQPGDAASIELHTTSNNSCVSGNSNASVDINLLHQIDIQANPINMRICPGEISTIDYTICNNGPQIASFDYRSLNLLSPSNFIQIIPNAFFNSFGQSATPMILTPGACTTIQLEFTASINPGEQVIIVFNIDEAQTCTSGGPNTWTTVTPAENVTVTTTPAILNLCNGQTSDISYTVCNTTSAITLPIPYTITVPMGINCTNCTGTIPNLTIGTCETITITVESNLLPNTGGWAELELGGSLYCLTGNNRAAILTPQELIINPLRPSLDICPGFTDQIEYEIINNNNATISFDYALWALGPDQNVVMNPAAGTITAAPGRTVLTVDITNNNPLGSIVTIRLVPVDLNHCIAFGSNLNVVVNTPQNCFFLDGQVFLGGVRKDFDPSFCELMMFKDVAIPNQSPYTALGYASTTCFTDDFYPWATLSVEVIDWVFVELRDLINPNMVICSKDALLLNDGRIFDPQSPQGVFLPLSFHDVPPGDYFVVVRHRNHLDVMSDAPINFSLNTVSTINFSNGSQAAGFQNVAAYNSLCNQITLWSLYAGDVNDDGVINASDRSSIYNALGDTGYIINDIVAEGIVDQLDQDRAWDNRNKVSNVP